MTDDDRIGEWEAAVRAMPRGAAVIARARDPKRRELLARTLLQSARPHGVLVLVAADAKLAFRLRADGVHVPEAGIAIVSGLRRANPPWRITSSAHGQIGLVRANRAHVDAVLLSPVFPTQSHPGAAALGPVRWAQLRAGVRRPVIALGGVSEANAQRAVAAGAAGLALIGGWI